MAFFLYPTMNILTGLTQCSYAQQARARQLTFLWNILIIYSLSGFVAPVYACTCLCEHDESCATMRADLSLEDIGKAGLAIGAAGLATYGVAKLGQWLFGATDRQIVNHIRETHQTIYARYDRMIRLIERASLRDVSEINEALLYDLAMVKYNGLPIRDFLRQMTVASNALAAEQGELRRRMQQVQETLWEKPALEPLYDLMTRTDAEVRAYMPWLDFTTALLTKHQAYFLTFECEDSLTKSYQAAIHVIDNAYGDRWQLATAIRDSILSLGYNHTSIYRYRAYLERLDSDMRRLDRRIHDLSYAYTNRRIVAQQLYDKLYRIREVVITMPQYLEETRLYEQRLYGYPL